MFSFPFADALNKSGNSLTLAPLSGCDKSRSEITGFLTSQL